MSDKNPSWTAWAIMVAAIVLIAIAFSRKSGVDRAVSERTPTRPTSVANILEELPDIAVDELVEAGWLTRSPVGEDPLLKDRMILLTHAINEHTARAVVERLFVLNGQDSAAPIDLYLASPGGWSGITYTIIDAINSIDAPVNTRAVGLCYSACAMVLTAGSGRRTATPNTILMVHAHEPSDDFDRLDIARDEKLWRENSSLPEDWYPMTAEKEYYLTAEQALNYKIIDEIMSPNKP